MRIPHKQRPTTGASTWMVPLLWALGMVPGVGAAAANPIQDLAALRTTVYTFLRVHAQNLDGRTEVTVGNIDSRLRLARCDAPLEAFLPSGDMHAGTITVGVRCPGTRPWRLYVSGRIRLYRPVVVLRRALVRGAVLSSGDLRRETRDVSSLHAAFLSDPARAVGLRLRRRAVAGALLRASWLAAPTLVHQGQRVILLAKSGGIEIRASGKALANGALGQRIAVRNLRSKRLVEGVVSTGGTVLVPM